MTDDVEIFCPDCRGKFSVEAEELVEEELLDCTLCAAELEVVSEDPIKLRLYDETNDFL